MKLLPSLKKTIPFLEENQTIPFLQRLDSSKQASKTLTPIRPVAVLAGNFDLNEDVVKLM